MTSHLYAQSPLRRLLAQFQGHGVVTTLAAFPNGNGGDPVYSGGLKIPNNVNVVYVTFSAQGSFDMEGSALLMNARVFCFPACAPGNTNNGVLIQPLATLGVSPTVTGWYTLVKLPEGQSGSAASSTIYFSGCVRLEPRHGDARGIVEIFLAPQAVGIAFTSSPPFTLTGRMIKKGGYVRPHHSS
jgi:hypothetical protein